MEGVEIERKWLVNADIFDSLKAVYGDKLQCVAHKHVDRTYLGMSPELRVSKYVDICDEVTETDLVTPHQAVIYRATIKTGSGIKRTEVEIDITEETFNLIRHVFNPAFIEKEYWQYVAPIGTGDEDYRIDVNQVIASDDSFYYVEVEFDTIEEANAYEPKFSYLEEVTHNAYWKMQHVWERITQKDLFN